MKNKKESKGGIPERYKNMGFTRVGQKKRSTRDGKKWMVLAKKGDKYKVVHGGDSDMDDYSQHGSEERKKRFWDRMGGRNSERAKDPFSPLYWHKRFGTWQEGGSIPFIQNFMSKLMNNSWRNWTPDNYQTPFELQNILFGFDMNQYNDQLSKGYEKFTNFPKNGKDWAEQQGFRFNGFNWVHKDGRVYTKEEIERLWEDESSKNRQAALTFQQGAKFAPIIGGLMGLNEKERISARAAENFDFLEKTQNPMAQNRGNFFAQQGMAIANALRQLSIDDLKDLQRSIKTYNSEEPPAIVNKKTKEVFSKQEMPNGEKVTVLMINGKPMEVLLKKNGDFTILRPASKDYLKGYKYQDGGYSLPNADGDIIEEANGFGWYISVEDKNPDNYKKEKRLVSGAPATVLVDETGQVVAVALNEEGEVDKDMRYTRNPKVAYDRKQGGVISKLGKNLQQRMGYKDNSPYKNRPFQYFNTDTLTMDGVSKPILAIADNGVGIVMQPNSGEYIFPGANNIIEIPIEQQGGFNSKMMQKSPILQQGDMSGLVVGIYGGMNPLATRKKKDPVLPYINFTNVKQAIPNLPNLFREGGYINQWNNAGRSKNSPTASKMRLPGGWEGRVLPIKEIVNEEGYIPQSSLTPIQAEVGEMIIHPTGDITPVSAKKRHHQMPKDMVTDMAPEGAYIVSAHGDVDIRKADAMHIITERSMEPYRLTGITPLPTQKTLADIMKKDMEKPAEIVKRIDSKFPVISAKNPFEVAANDQNKVNRLPYLQGVILLSEIERELNEQSKPKYMRSGGIVIKNNLINAEGGGTPWDAIVSGVGGLFNAIGGVFQRRNQNRLLNNYQAETQKDINNLNDERERNLAASSAISAASVLAQDSNVRWKDLQSQRLYRPEFVYAQMQALQDAAFRNRPNISSNMSPQNAAYTAMAGYAAALNSISDSVLKLNAMQEQMRIQDLMNQQSINNANIQGRTAAINQTVAGNNQKLSQLGSIGRGYFIDKSNIATDTFSLNNYLRNSILSAKINQRNFLQDFGTALAGAGPLITKES